MKFLVLFKVGFLHLMFILTVFRQPVNVQAFTDSKPKILCLHGGGGSGPGFRQLMQDIIRALSSDYEFFFPTAPEGNLWVQDPPNGKGQPTTDPDFASTSVEYLNDYIATNGPFVGILGHSQGSMFTTYYLSTVPVNTFEFAVMFCGYLPDTHLGLLASINDNSPFGDIPSLVFMGARDWVISNPMTRAQARKFTAPLTLRSTVAEHNPPTRTDPTFDQVIQFIREGYAAGGMTTTIMTTISNQKSNKNNKSNTNRGNRGKKKRDDGKGKRGGKKGRKQGKRGKTRGKRNINNVNARTEKGGKKGEKGNTDKNSSGRWENWRSGSEDKDGSKGKDQYKGGFKGKDHYKGDFKGKEYKDYTEKFDYFGR